MKFSKFRNLHFLNLKKFMNFVDQKAQTGYRINYPQDEMDQPGFKIFPNSKNNAPKSNFFKLCNYA